MEEAGLDANLAPICQDILVVFNLQTHIFIQLRVKWTVFVTE